MADIPIGSMLPLRWAEEPTGARYGEGVSRPKAGRRTREYRLLVFQSGAQPLTWITRAETKRHAIKYAEARWPGAEVEVA